MKLDRGERYFLIGEISDSIERNNDLILLLNMELKDCYDDEKQYLKSRISGVKDDIEILNSILTKLETK